MGTTSHRGRSSDPIHRAALVLVRRRRPAERIVAQLQAKGASEREARAALAAAQNEVVSARLGRGNLLVVTGVVVFLIGAGLTALSFAAGERIIIWYGAVFWGLLQISMGIAQRSSWASYAKRVSARRR